MRLLRLRFLSGSRLGFFIALLLATPGFPALAGDGKPGTDRSTPPAVRTGKERLGPKWSDEQRIDNCNVPPDKRGNKPRPSVCVNAPPS
jgi:hypothetical protein